MKYVLDTNVVSALMRGDIPAIGHLRAVGRADVLLPQPAVAEIEYGLHRMARSKRRNALTLRFDALKGEIARAVWSDEVSAAFGKTKALLEKKGERIEDFDIAVAAHALAYSAVLVTTNVKHLARVPDIVVEDWSK